MPRQKISSPPANQIGGREITLSSPFNLCHALSSLPPPITSHSRHIRTHPFIYFYQIPHPSHLSFPIPPQTPSSNHTRESATPRKMTTMTTSAAITFPSFTGLKVGQSARSCPAKVPVSPAQALSVKASLKEVGVAVAATAASAMLASNALAIEVLLGGNDGTLAFVPREFSVSPGEKIVFKNNAGFPHNVVFDEDEIPSGVDASKISMSEEDLLNAPGEVYSVTLDAKGTYSFYCSPHQGAGMIGKVTVN